MSTRLSSPIRIPAPARLAAVAVLFAGLQLAGGPRTARAGCLDWLFGRPQTQTAYYPPTASYAAAYPPAYQAAYPPAYPVTAGVVQAQRPAYGLGATAPVQTFDNPSVYTGLPAAAAVAAPPNVEVQRLPLATTVSPTPVNPAYSNPAFGTPAYGTPAYGTAPATLELVDSYRLPLSSPGAPPIASTLRGNAGVNPIVSSPYSSYSPAAAAPIASTPTAVATTNYAAPAQAVPRPHSPSYRLGDGRSGRD